MTTTHRDNITVTITLESAPAQVVGFGVSALLVDEAAGNALGGDRFATYTSKTETAAAVTAGEITAATKAILDLAFDQIPAPASVMVIRVDTAGAETYPDAIALAVTAGAEFYGVALDDRTAATQLAVAAAVAGTRRLMAYSSSDAGWQTAGYPAAFSAIEGNERAILEWHEDAANEWPDWCKLNNRLAYDPDVQSAPWDCPLQSVTPYATIMSQAERDALDANQANNGARYYSATYFSDPGVTHANRPVHEMITADWFATRLEEAVERIKVSLSATGRKLPMTRDGQSRIEAAIFGLFEQGVTAGHFKSGTTSVSALTITPTDEGLGRLRFSGEAQFQNSARIFSFDFNFYRTTT